MAKQRYVNTRFWDDYYISNLDPTEKLIFLYCITNPATSIVGIYEIPLKRIALDTGIDKDMIIKIFDRFGRDGKILYKNGWVIIMNFVKHQNAKSPKIQAGIDAEWEKIPESIKKYGMYTISHSNTNTNTNTNSNTNVQFMEWWDKYDNKKSKKKAYALWVKLESKDIEKCLVVVDKYVESTPDAQYRKHPDTYLRNECWNDEITIIKNNQKSAETAEEQLKRLGIT